VGTVTDQSQGVIPGVSIVVTNVETGVASPTTTTNGLGNYAIHSLSAARFRVEADAPGFKKFIREDISLDTGRKLRVDFRMETGAVTESVTVTGATSMVQTETGTLNATVEQEQVVEMPILGRDAQLLSLLTPGVVETNLQSSGVAGGYDRIMGGGLLRRDDFLLDGAHNQNFVYGTWPVKPNPDNLQEFQVVTNAFSAEYGEISDGIMIATTKSGTNEFHGVLFEFFRNDKLNAGNWFTHARPAPLRFDQYGGNMGGPLRKNKTFFFVATQEQLTHGATVYTNYTVPIPAFRAGDFSSLLGAQVGTDALGNSVLKNEIFDPLSSRTVTNAAGQQVVVRDPFYGNRIPASRLSPAAIKIAALYPLPTVGTIANNFNITPPV
jgi:hypothetical protein